MSNFLRGLGQLAGVAGQAVQGYGMDRENAVKQAMLVAREKRDAEQQTLAQKVAELNMKRGTFSDTLEAMKMGGRAPSAINANLQRQGAPSGQVFGGVALPENLGAVAQIASQRGQMIDIPGGASMEIDPTQTPEAKTAQANFQDYTRRSTDRRAERAVDSQDRRTERAADQKFDLQRDELRYSRDRDLANTRAQSAGSGGVQLSNAAIEKLNLLDDAINATTTATGAMATAKAARKDVSGRVGGILPVPAWVRNQFGQGGEEGRSARGKMGNLTSMIGNLRSGGAITPQEFDRLETFLPTANDDEAIIDGKLADFLAALKQTRQTRLSNYQTYGKGGTGEMTPQYTVPNGRED